MEFIWVNWLHELKNKLTTELEVVFLILVSLTSQLNPYLLKSSGMKTIHKCLYWYKYYCNYPRGIYLNNTLNTKGNLVENCAATDALRVPHVVNVLFNLNPNDSQVCLFAQNIFCNKPQANANECYVEYTNKIVKDSRIYIIPSFVVLWTSSGEEVFDGNFCDMFIAIVTIV